MLSRVSALARSGRILLLLAWMALLTYWSSQGNLPIDAPPVAGLLHNVQHKVAHLCAFGLLGLLAWWAFDGLPRSWLLAVLLVSAFGASDEWHQSFTPGRRAAVDDWALDTLSAALAVFVWSCLRASRLHVRLRPLAPVAISAMFLVGVVLAVRPSVSRTELEWHTAAHAAIDVARSTRDVARQIRSTVLG